MKTIIEMIITVIMIINTLSSTSSATVESEKGNSKYTIPDYLEIEELFLMDISDDYDISNVKICALPAKIDTK